MARKRPRKRQVRSRVQRDVRTIATRAPRVLHPARLKPLSLAIDVEDRRTFHPARASRPALSFSGVQHRLVAPVGVTRREAARVPRRVVFYQPDRVIVCARRRSRREVLFALGRTGKGAKSRRSRNMFSDVSCRR